MIQRFHQVLGEALEVGFQSTVQKGAVKGLRFPDGFSVFDPNARGNKPDATAVYIAHSVERPPQTDLLKNHFQPPSETERLILRFVPLPEETPVDFQRLNFKQTKNFQVPGMICGRPGEEKPFAVRQRTQSLNDPVGYVNLDFLSKTKERGWVPLYLKYRYQVAAPLKNHEYGYLRIDADRCDRSSVVVEIRRVPESEVPEFLRTAQTLPV